MRLLRDGRPPSRKAPSHVVISESASCRRPPKASRHAPTPIHFRLRRRRPRSPRRRATRRHRPPARDSAMINRSPNPVLAPFRFRSIGPASMGGRVDDIEVAPSDPNMIYVGYATGGVFKSDNNGTTFAPVFETYGSASIGDIAIHPTNANIVYVGTGEANNRQTSSFGDGIYKSEDGGKTFSNVGLKETQTIARIVIDPKSPDVVYVAAPGHLFGPNPDGGVYKTTDGGKSWDKIKYVDENTGFTDIAMDPSNSQDAVRGELSAPPQRMLLQRRRSRERALEVGQRGPIVGRASPATGCRVERSAASRSRCRKSNPNVVYAQIEAGAAAEAEAPARGAGAWRGGRRRSGRWWRRRSGRRSGPVGMTGATTPVPDADSAEGAVDAARGAADTTNRTPPAVDAQSLGRFQIRQQGQVVDGRQQLRRSAALLQPDPRRSEQRTEHLRRRRAHGEVARRRQDVPAARQRGRLLQHGRGPARDLDRSEERRTTSCAATTPASWSHGTRARHGSTCARWRRRCRTG